jgi:hypothetical protein
MPLASPPQESTTAPDQTCTDALLLRNYEGAQPVTVDVTISDDGTPVHETTVTLDPLTLKSIDLPIAPGDYRVQAATDDNDAASICTLGTAPTELAFVEAGNGIVSVVGEAY